MKISNTYRHTLFLSVFLWSVFDICAQSNFYLSIPASEKDKLVLNQFAYPTIFSEKTLVEPALKELVHNIRQSGYFAASIDDIEFIDSMVIAPIHIGLHYDQLIVQNGNISEEIWHHATIGHYTKQRYLSYRESANLKEDIIAYAANNGYPFASVWLDDIRINASQIIAKMYWNKGPLITIGTLSQERDKAISDAYLQKYLALETGEIFDKEKIETAWKKLQSLPFVTNLRQPTILFEENKANLHFFLKPQKTNYFDFLIGVLPNSTTTNGVLITTDIDASFANVFRKGEKFSIQFERLRPETQQLRLAVTYPYILNTSFGIELDFELYRRDSTYRDLNWHFGIQYPFSSTHIIKAFSQSLTTTLLDNSNTNVAIEQNMLPSILDTRYNAFGLAYYNEKLDNPSNPRKGWTIDFKGSAGFKTISQNEAIINNSNLQDLYDDINTRSFQYRLTTQIANYIPFRQRNTLHIGLRAATILANEVIFSNEQFRIGGAKLLRGFDEQSILVSNYVIWTTEYRYLIGKKSYLSIFSDFAWINREDPAPYTDWPLSLGAGMVFETKAGLLEIAYALGKLRDTPFDFKRAKIHFGFIYDF